MSTIHHRMQRIFRMYKEKTGKLEIDMKEVAKWAVANGWPLPKPVDPLDRLAHDFAQAAREEVLKDEETGQPYRVNHAVTVTRHGQQLVIWIDINEAKRRPMHRSLMMRRNQMIGDGLQLTLDADHWNRIHSDEKRIDIPLDFTYDIEWRKNSPEEKAS
jgi:hypothetical protein